MTVDEDAVSERLTDRALRVVVLAQEEARMLNHDRVSTEHLLLGLLNEGAGVAAKALGSLGISLESVRHQVEEIVGRGTHAPDAQIPLAADARTALKLSQAAARHLDRDYIGTEHVLLGLIGHKDWIAVRVLANLGTDEARIRSWVLQHMSERDESTGMDQPGSTEVTESLDGELLARCPWRNRGRPRPARQENRDRRPRLKQSLRGLPTLRLSRRSRSCRS
jgi:ATP-dependent Clp protease ATP-binding subunit ClpC